MKIGFIDTVHPILWESLTSINQECVDLTSNTLEEIKLLISDFDGIVIRSRIKLDENLLKSANNLKFIARSGAGLENIDVDYCNANGIVLFNAPEGNRNAVGEQALGMLLALFNNIIIANNEVKSRIWRREANRGIELEGKTIGIIGFGNNGQAFAEKLAGFNVTILAHDKYKTNFGTDKVKEVSLEFLKENAQVISLHIPQTNETIGLINDSFIEEVKKPFYLLNLARGKIVETKALVTALKNNNVLGACLDVNEFEDSSFGKIFEEGVDLSVEFEYLLNSAKVILTPHVGGWTHESYFKLSRVLFEKFRNHYQL
ncbi:phosphoglycerate dehydrogenase [Putridiphycobacter roseus]|uniref:Phosphoglycerate dehydrogenase n=1 Tax=Putridiphycobacter roseus TaxID=2219161 RepID=A0A2W1NJD4_9FLAO|nr:NAD(P)-dependent oxidoreductase [Putridiphycobacter roseus]PZE15732.1 phosphoglycerate dehydrogenase [Putridiphycobacter roseus]